ncbi:hypothetical protein QTP88_011960 [Uroleucon formosanum]
MSDQIRCLGFIFDHSQPMEEAFQLNSLELTLVCRSSLGKHSQHHGQVQDNSSKAPKIIRAYETVTGEAAFLLALIWVK